jgi:hypothetical protein
MLGFISPQNENDSSELNAARDEWLAWQVAEAWNAHQSLIRDVDKYCEQLELLDPDGHSAAQTKAEVRLRLNKAGSIRERLEILTNEAQRLKRAVAAKRQSNGDSFLRRGFVVFLVGLVVVLAAWSFGILQLPT